MNEGQLDRNYENIYCLGEKFDIIRSLNLGIENYECAENFKKLNKVNSNIVYKYSRLYSRRYEDMIICETRRGAAKYDEKVSDDHIRKEIRQQNHTQNFLRTMYTKGKGTALNFLNIIAKELET